MCDRNIERLLTAADRATWDALPEGIRRTLERAEASIATATDDAGVLQAIRGAADQYGRFIKRPWFSENFAVARLQAAVSGLNLERRAIAAAIEQGLREGQEAPMGGGAGFWRLGR